MDRIPFNRPHVVGTERDYIDAAIATGHLSGNGAFGDRCTTWLREIHGSHTAMLTPSATGALEMMALLLELDPGDEVIMPSFAFVSCANAFALRGAVPVFVDIGAGDHNLDPEQVAAAVTSRTRAVLALHYAGVSCDMRALSALCRDLDLVLLEDAAHALLAQDTDGRTLGGIGAMAALSFHETKNLHCGEGGALLVNDARYAARAEVLQEKGTNRSRFFRGQVDKYTWVDLGSSYLLSEINAAFLWGQFERAREITERRGKVWREYQVGLSDLAGDGRLSLPVAMGNAHSFGVSVTDGRERDGLIRHLDRLGIHATFHYVPLHSSIGGRRLGRAHGRLPRTAAISERLVRLPLWIDLQDDQIGRVIEGLLSYGPLLRASPLTDALEGGAPRPPMNHQTEGRNPG